MLFKKMSVHKPINRDGYVEAIRGKLKNDHFLILASTAFALWFASIDPNADGKIQTEEFVSFFHVLDFQSEFAKVAFQSLDSNNDGLLNLDEYVSSGMDFLTSKDESSRGKLSCL